MTLQEREVNGVVILELSGKIMGGPDAALLNEKLHELVEQGKKKVVADLSGVQFINSSGLGILIGGLTTMRNNGGDLKLARAADRVKTLLSVSNLESVFQIFDDLDAAIASFRE